MQAYGVCVRFKTLEPIDYLIKYVMNIMILGDIHFCIFFILYYQQ